VSFLSAIAHRRTSSQSDLTGSSNAVFVLALSLVSGNVGGTTKKVLCTAAIFVGVAVGELQIPSLPAIRRTV
jgi:hypothetical protein